MENYNNTPSTENKNYRKSSIFFMITSIVLAVLLVCSLLRTRTATQEAKEVTTMQYTLQNELDSIMREYELTKDQYGELNTQLSQKDSAILAQAEEIQKLIAQQGDYNRVKKKLALLQSQGKEYVRLLDSLYTANEVLTVENKKFREENTKLSETNKQLNNTQDSLSRRIKTASLLKAYNVSLKGVNMKSGGKVEEVTNRCRRVEKFKVSFTLGENAITDAGSVNLYCRLSIPSGKVLSLGDGDAYSFTNEGKTLQYTIKSTIEYANKAQDVNMYWNLREGDQAVPGSYTAQIFTDDEYIGEATVTLK